jgi:hypothetical protein
LAELNGYPKGVHYRAAMERRSVGRKTGCSKGGKTQGPISGKMAVESGQLASIRGMGGKVSGKIVGKKNVESGHISALGKSSRKLTYEDAQLIRKLCVKKQYKQKELAKMYCVTPMIISLIINNKTYINP